MEPPRQKLFARLALAAFAVLGLLWLARLDYRAKISTDVIDLIPKDERSPELSLVRSLASERQARTLLFALRQNGAPAPAEATRRFVAELKASGLFTEVADLADPAARDALGAFIFSRRLDLLLPGWLATRQAEFNETKRPAAEFSPWLAERVATDLDAFVAKPESVAFQDLVPRDPLLLIPTLVEKTQVLEGRHSSKTALVWASLGPSPFTEEGQQPAFAAIDRASAAARAEAAGLEIQWTGINRFAAESRRRITAELSWLNTLSIAAVLGVACVFVRRIWKVVHLIPVILLSLLGAWTVSTAAFGRLHVLVFVVGSLLSGVAIDYGFYLYMQPALHPNEPFREKLSRLIKPLLASCLTTVLGFSFLLFSELPLIRQLGVFVSAGLVSALIGAILYFAQLERPFLETRNPPRPDPTRSRKYTRALGVLACAAALLGLFRLSWRDDIRELDIPAPDLRANDQSVRALFGESPNRTVFITRGQTLSDARMALDRFLKWHDARYPDSPAASAGWLIPSPADWNATPERLRNLPQFVADLGAALEKHGYSSESFAPFFEAWRRRVRVDNSEQRYQRLATDTLAHLTGPLGLLVQSGPGGTWFLSLADHASGQPPPADLSTFAVAQLESLNSLFSRYRISALRLSATGLALVGASVFVLYGLRRGVRIFMIPAGSCLAAFGLLGLAGHPLNLFHLLGAFLGVCLSHNYAIFSAENADRHEAPPPSIRLSALTTAASFGVLAFSKIPVVSALGTMVALIVLTALLTVELEPLAAGKRR
ncbi:hypothetical protein DB347_03135 [Opitutaceae bacterium EW11]|nr:hypothetical protein DB347_03135 [Opitutaceae bacterium EW11]